MEVRLASMADLGLLAELNEQLIQDEGHRGRLQRAELESRMEQWLRDDYLAHLFYRDGQSAGYVLHRDEEEHVYVRHFFVVRSRRRQGVGKAAFTWMRQHVWHDRRIRLDVLVHNERALRFWKSLRFHDYCLTLELEAENGA